MVFFFPMRVRWRLFLSVAVLVALSFLAIGCGESSDKNGGKSTEIWRVEVVDADFPLKQRLAEPVELKIEVRNAGDTTIPELAVTVDGFNYRSTEKGVADPKRPVWTVNEPPPGSASSNVNTYILGELEPGKTVKAVWKLTAVVAGSHTVKYKVAGNVNGDIKTLLADGSAPEGAFVVTVSEEPKPIQQ